MPRTITLHPLSLAVGASVIGGAFLLASQTLPPPQVVWPPPKALMLNFFDPIDPDISLPPGAQHIVLTVPTDRWLTITGAYANIPNATSRWIELTAGGQTVVKGYVVGGPIGQNPPSDCGGPVGWTIAPGSTLALINVDTSTGSLRDLGLIGYYSRN